MDITVSIFVNIIRYTMVYISVDTLVDTYIVMMVDTIMKIINRFMSE